VFTEHHYYTHTIVKTSAMFASRVVLWQCLIFQWTLLINMYSTCASVLNTLQYVVCYSSVVQFMWKILLLYLWW